MKASFIITTPTPAKQSFIGHKRNNITIMKKVRPLRLTISTPNIYTAHIALLHIQDECGGG